jgi:hypothetical protein
MACQAKATRPCNSLAWAGSAVCCHAPRGLMCSPARTAYQDVSPRSGVLVRMVGAFECVWRNVGLRENTRPDSGPVRRAGRPARCRRSRFRRTARASVGATARRTTVSQAAVRAQGIGQSLPLRADIVARTVPLRSSIGLMIEAPDVASGIPDPETRIRRQGSP